MASTSGKNVSEIERPTRIGDFPAAMPDDEPTEALWDKKAREDALKADENTEFETDEETGQVRVRVNNHFANPSSTYPGRNADLQAADMALPTPLDLARRAKAAGSQIPEIVFAAGLAEEAGADPENTEEREAPDHGDNSDDE